MRILRPGAVLLCVCLGTVQAFAAATQVATVTPAVAASYGPGAIVSLNVPPAWQPTHVLAPGSTIQIPLAGSPAPTRLTQPTDPFGTDLAVDDQGFLAWTATGDLQTASGVANLTGALTRRLQTALDTLALHPFTYGSGLPTMIGHADLVAHVVRGYVRQALLADPRVVRVTHVTAVQTGTVWQITAQVAVRNLAQAVPVSAVLLAA
jgi:hypothetical protein